MTFRLVRTYCGLRKLTHKINHHRRETRNHCYPSIAASSACWLSFLGGICSLSGGDDWAYLKKHKKQAASQWKGEPDLLPQQENLLCLPTSTFSEARMTSPLLFGWAAPTLTLRIHLLQRLPASLCKTTWQNIAHETHAGRAVFCFGLVQRFLNWLSKLHLAYNSLWFDMSDVGERDEFHLILTKQLSTTSSFPLFHFNKQWI